MDDNFNSIVKAGQLIAELDPSILQTQVDVQQANLLRSQVDLEQRKISLENDKKKLERQKELFAKNLVTKEQLEAAELAVKLDEASVNSSNASLVQTQANLETAKLNLSYSKIYAPIDGVITEIHREPGELLLDQELVRWVVLHHQHGLAPLRQRNLLGQRRARHDYVPGDAW